MLSARALGILYYVVVTNEPPTVKVLEQAFKEGREAIRKAVKELEEMGFIERANTKINARFITESRVTEAGIKYLSDAGFWARATRVSGHLYKHSKQNNHILLTAINLQEYTDGVRDSWNDNQIESTTSEEETFTVGYDFFGSTSSDSEEFEEMKRSVAKYKAEKAEERLEGKINQASKKLMSRTSKPKNLWTSSDIGYEFSDRLLDIWNIKPWSIVKTRFIQALADMRARLGTDGQVEYEMLDLFFKQVDFQTHDDPHILWKMFIKRAPELAVLARRANVSEEQLAKAQEAADKSWDWIDE